jgi:chloramphenicol 3-O-phosphotransferase
MNKEIEAEEIEVEEIEAPVIKVAPVVETKKESGVYCAVKKIHVNGKHYFKDDVICNDVVESDIAYLLYRGLIVLY